MIDQSMSSVLDEFSDQKILVVGDMMIDEYLHGTVDRISPEAPVQVVDVTEEKDTLGGAGNVVKNLRTLNSEVSVLSVIGEGQHGKEIKEKIEDLSVSSEGLIKEEGRLSSKKTRVLADSYNQQIIRIDRETRDDLNKKTYQILMEQYDEILPSLDGVIISDYGKGLLTSKFCRNILKKARKRDVPSVVDPKGSKYNKYSEASIVAPNTKEAEQVTGIEIKDDRSLQKAGTKLLKQQSAEAILITRGSEGMALFETPGLSFQQFEAQAREVYDVTGAGDTVVSMISLGLSVSGNYSTAAKLANTAAGIVVGKVGTATVTVDELREKMS